MSTLSAFVTHLINFLNELHDTFPESKEIRMGIDAVSSAKKINPRLIVDVFNVHINVPLSESIYNKNIEEFRNKITESLKVNNNEFLSSVKIFEERWHELSVNNRETIWKYLKVLCVLCEKIVHAK